jgi:hypothetical protein
MEVKDIKTIIDVAITLFLLYVIYRFITSMQKTASDISNTVNAAGDVLSNPGATITKGVSDYISNGIVYQIQQGEKAVGDVINTIQAPTSYPDINTGVNVGFGGGGGGAR